MTFLSFHETDVFYLPNDHFFSSQNNVGGPNSFIPICAYTYGFALYNEAGTNDGGKSNDFGTAAFKMDLVFVTDKNWITKAQQICSQEVQQECCSADAINDSSKLEKEEKKKYCKSLGCGKCPNRSRRARSLSEQEFNNFNFVQHPPSSQLLIQRALIAEDLSDNAEDLSDKDFNRVLKKYTDLDPTSTGAIVGETNVEDIAVCRDNSYNATENETPTLNCGEYETLNCVINDYIIVNPDETEICIPNKVRIPLVVVVIFSFHCMSHTLLDFIIRIPPSFRL